MQNVFERSEKCFWKTRFYFWGFQYVIKQNYSTNFNHMLCCWMCPALNIILWVHLKFILFYSSLQFHYLQRRLLNQPFPTYEIKIVSGPESITFPKLHIRKSEKVNSGDLASHTIGPPLPIQRCRRFLTKYFNLFAFLLCERWYTGLDLRFSARWRSPTLFYWCELVFGYKSFAGLNWEGMSDSVAHKVTRLDSFRFLFDLLYEALRHFCSAMKFISYK